MTPSRLFTRSVLLSTACALLIGCSLFGNTPPDTELTGSVLPGPNGVFLNVWPDTTGELAFSTESTVALFAAASLQNPIVGYNINSLPIVINGTLPTGASFISYDYDIGIGRGTVYALLWLPQPGQEGSYPIELTVNGDTIATLNLTYAGGEAPQPIPAFVKVPYNELDAILDNLQTVSQDLRDRIEGFFVMIDYETDDPDRTTKLAAMETVINRAASEGYQAIPGLNYKVGVETPVGASSEHVVRAASWRNETEHAARVQNYLEQLADMRTDDQLVIDFQHPYLAELEALQEDITTYYVTRKDYNTELISAWGNTLFPWADQHNVRLLLLPGGPDYLHNLLIAHRRPTASLLLDTLPIAPSFAAGDLLKVFNTMEDLVLQNTASELIGIPTYDGMTAEILRNRAQPLYNALRADASAFWINVDEANDGSYSSLFTQSWFDAQ